MPVQPPGPVLAAPVVELPRLLPSLAEELFDDVLGVGDGDGDADGVGVGLGLSRSCRGAGLSDGDGDGDTLALGVGVGVELGFASRSANAVPAGTSRMNRNNAITRADMYLRLFMCTASLLRLRLPMVGNGTGIIARAGAAHPCRT